MAVRGGGRHPGPRRHLSGWHAVSCWSVLALVAAVSVVVAARSAATAEATPRRTILIFGDSLTSGYGTSRADAFPAVLQARIDSLGWPFQVVNAGLSGETSAAGLRRIDWVLQRPVDVFVLELGGNDGLRGLPTEPTEHSLQLILDRVEDRYPEAALVVAGMRLPPNLGPEYTADFQAIYPRLAEANGAVLVPFLLEGVATEDGLMLPDGIHPTAAGHREIAHVVWPYLEPVLAELMEGEAGSD